MVLGLALAVLTAIATNLAFLFKHRGAVSAPAVDARHLLRSAAGLFRTPAWTIGFTIAVGAWALHVAALALAPLSVVQAVISGGLVFLAVLAERFFGFHLGRRQWVGLAVTATGLAFVGITGGEQPDVEQSEYSLAALIAFESSVLALGGLLVAVSLRVERLRAREGALLGTAAGALFGVSDVAIKYLAEPVLDSVLSLVSPWTVAALVASVIAFYSSARGLQLGPGIEVITLTSVAANLAAIVGAILVFHDQIGNGALEIVGRIAAFCLVIFGAGLMPGPVRAGEAAAARGEMPPRRSGGQRAAASTFGD
jgi:drug/metabolite transporter (DMT)-like permease